MLCLAIAISVLELFVLDLECVGVWLKDKRVRCTERVRDTKRIGRAMRLFYCSKHSKTLALVCALRTPMQGFYFVRDP